MPDPDQPSSPSRAERLASAWAWAHNPAAVPDPSRIDPATVVAVMVVHNAEEWLPRQLVALARLEPRPGTILVVDNGSTDGSPALLDKALAEGVIDDLIAGSAAQGFGAAVAQALTGRDVPEWLWLLHDDSEPKRAALGRLLQGAETQDADVIAPKLLEPKRRNYPDQVQEIGQSISSRGRRVLTVEPGDIDQAQADSTRTLGASTAGLLIRGEVWSELGGLDPALPLYRDGVEFGWRANLSGFKVITWPAASLYHRQAGRAAWRITHLSDDPDIVDRVAAMRLVAAHAERPGPAQSGLVLNSLGRSLGMLLGKSPGAAWGELVALRRFLGSKDATRDLRARVSGLPRAQAEQVAALRPGRFGGVSHALDRMASAVAERYRDLTTDDSDTGIDDLTGDDFAGGRNTRRFASPVVVMTVVLIVFGLLAGRGFLGASVSGGALLPAPGSLTDAWRAYVTPDVTMPGTNAPWLLLAALASTVTLGQPWLLVVLGSVLAPVLAGWAMVSLLRRLVSSTLIWGVLGLVWGMTVVAMGLLGVGSVTGITASIALPHFVRSVLVWRERPQVGAERWRAPAAAAGWTIVLTAVLPLFWVLALAGAIVWAVIERARIAELATSVALSGLFFIGWVPRLVAHPMRLFTGIDPLAYPDTAPSMAGLMFGRINPAHPDRWVSVTFFGVLWLAFAVAMVFGVLTRRVQAILLGCVGLGMALAALISRLAVTVSGGVARPDVSVWMLIAFGTMVVSIALSLREDAETGSLDGRLNKAVAAGLTLASLVTMGWFTVFGTAAATHDRPTLLPSYAHDVQRTARASRALMIEVNGASVRWIVTSATQPQWGTAERNPTSPSPGIADRYAGLASSLSQGSISDQLAADLTELGVSHVWIRGIDADRIAAISNVVGLTRAAADDATNVWTVTGLVSRARVVTGEGVTPVADGLVPPGSGERKLVLAEAPDARWRATLNGTELEPAADQPLQTFVLRPEPGRVEWHLQPSWLALTWQVLLVAVLTVLAAPVAQSGAQARRAREE